MDQYRLEGEILGDILALKYCWISSTIIFSLVMHKPEATSYLMNPMTYIHDKEI